MQGGISLTLKTQNQVWPAEFLCFIFYFNHCFPLGQALIKDRTIWLLWFSAFWRHITVSVQASNSGFFLDDLSFSFYQLSFILVFFLYYTFLFLSLPSLLPSPSHHLFNISKVWGYSCMHGSEVKNHTFTSWVHLS